MFLVDNFLYVDRAQEHGKDKRKQVVLVIYLAYVVYNMEDTKFKVGDKVDKITGYSFPGTVVSVFKTTTDKIRLVVEMDNFGLLHIFNEEGLKKTNEN